MKKIFLTLGLIAVILSGNAQQIWSEGFQSYTGNGDPLTGGWTNTGPGGFKVYLRALSADSNVKNVEINLLFSKVSDSLITPSLGPLAANSVLTFKSRLIETFTGVFATFNHLPLTGEKVVAYISTDGGNTYQFLRDLLSGYPGSGSSVAFNNFTIPIDGFEGQNVKIKIVVVRKAGAPSWNGCFDDFSLSNLTSSKSLKSNAQISLIPNPSYGSVQVNAPGFGTKADVDVFNLLGTRVLSTNLQSEKVFLNLSDLKPGIYLIKVTEGKQTAVNRLILK